MSGNGEGKAGDLTPDGAVTADYPPGSRDRHPTTLTVGGELERTHTKILTFFKTGFLPVFALFRTILHNFAPFCTFWIIIAKYAII